MNRTFNQHAHVLAQLIIASNQLISDFMVNMALFKLLNGQWIFIDTNGSIF